MATLSVVRGVGALGVVVLGGVAAADQLARWPVYNYHGANNGGAVTPLLLEASAAHVSAGPITAGPGLNSLDPCGPMLSLLACSGTGEGLAQYYSTAFDPADYFEFAVTAEPGYAITYQGLVMPMGIRYIVDREVPANGRSTGAKTWELRYSLDGFATPGTTVWVGSPFPLSIQGLPGRVVGASEEVRVDVSLAAVGTRGGTVTFRWYGYNAEMQHPNGPQGYSAGPMNRTGLGWPRLDVEVLGTVGSSACYANCDGSTVAPVLNVADFVCFQTLYAAGASGANCDGSTVAPVLNVADFLCFQTAYAGGCP